MTRNTKGPGTLIPALRQGTAWPRRRQFKVLLAGLLGLGAPSTNAQSANTMVTEVLTIGYRSLPEIIEVISPLVPPPGVVTGMQNRLVIKTTAENLAEIKALLVELDRAPANLMISVRHVLDEEVRGDLASAGVRVDRRDLQVDIGSARPPRRGASVSGSSNGISASATLSSGRGSQSSRDTQRLRVLEGRQAFIHVGASLPYPQTDVVGGAGGTTVIRSTQFVDTGTGFFVRPRLQSERVTLEVSTHRDGATLASGRQPRGAIPIRETSTSVSGRLARWMQLSGTTSDASTSGRGTGRTRSAGRTTSYTVYVKVDLAR